MAQRPSHEWSGGRETARRHRVGSWEDEREEEEKEEREREREGELRERRQEGGGVL